MVTGKSGADGLYPFGYQSAPATPAPSTNNLPRTGIADELSDFLRLLSGRTALPLVTNKNDGTRVRVLSNGVSR